MGSVYQKYLVLAFARVKEGEYASRMKRLGVVAMVLLAFAGLADNFYLLEHEESGTPLLCNIQNLTGCNIVANSKYSHLFGVPIADVGVALYSVLFIVAALELVLGYRTLRRALQAFALIGLALSLVSAAMQIFVIHALCIYCLGSGVIALLIFILAWGIEPIYRRHIADASTSSSQPTVSDMLTMPPV